jgi:truncated hemoglobin YjbI
MMHAQQPMLLDEGALHRALKAKAERQQEVVHQKVARRRQTQQSKDRLLFEPRGKNIGGIERKPPRHPILLDGGATERASTANSGMQRVVYQDVDRRFQEKQNKNFLLETRKDRGELEKTPSKPPLLLDKGTRERALKAKTSRQKGVDKGVDEKVDRRRQTRSSINRILGFFDEFRVSSHGDSEQDEPKKLEKKRESPDAKQRHRKELKEEKSRLPVNRKQTAAQKSSSTTLSQVPSTADTSMETTKPTSEKRNQPMPSPAGLGSISSHSTSSVIKPVKYIFDPAMEEYIDTLGGMENVECIATCFYDNAMADPELKPFFRKIKTEQVRNEFIILANVEVPQNFESVSCMVPHHYKLLQKGANIDRVVKLWEDAYESIWLEEEIDDAHRLLVNPSRAIFNLRAMEKLLEHSRKASLSQSSQHKKKKVSRSLSGEGLLGKLRTKGKKREKR